MPDKRQLLPFALGAALVALPLQLWAGSKPPEPAPVSATVDMTSARPAMIDKCETCHGIDGNSLHFDFPKLAGQRRDYLLKQMRDIKSGKRKVDVMVPVISLLDDKQIVELADYLSSRPLVKGNAPTDPASAKVGKKIFDLGVPYRMVAQCSACHGTYAEGRSDPGLIQDGFGGFPALNGQHAAYTIKQLTAFREGARKNDFNSMMHNLAKNMSDQEISMVANYLASMELPPPVVETAVVAVPAPAKAATCAACHGPTGNSIAPTFPKLAGQQHAYIAKQLTDMKSGARKAPLMVKVLEGIEAEDIEALATYYASQVPATAESAADDAVVTRGMTVFFEGTPGALACYSCHNFDGRGSEDFGLSPGGYPMLFGQHSAYVGIQLRAFKTGDRKNDHNQVMRNVAKGMTDEDIDAVSAFIQEMKY